ncbi:MAG: hypothetical protein JNM13_14815 [Hyphomicrobiaceae bacterium]|nr:hypothetical protein [Hyphomicrobiaceae bacterium]
MLAIFRKLTGGTATANDIKGALAALDFGAADKAVTRAEAARRAAIVAADDAAITRAESALTRARLDLERLQIAKGELEARLADAISSEAGARLDRIAADAERQRDQARERLRKEGVDAMKRLCAVLSDVAAAAEVVAQANATLSAAGRPAIASVESEFTPAPQGQYEALFHVAVNVRLPEIAAWGVAGWPQAPRDHWREIASAGLPDA